jgi:hypothetical protein
MPRRIPVSRDDPVNHCILAVAEDQLRGFVPDPFGEISARCGHDPPTVIQRIRAMRQAGVIRRVRQTLVTTNLTDGALIAWQVPEDLLDAAFEHLLRHDPFTGHIVLREAEPGSPGADYRLWTTLKVPHGFSLERHVSHLAGRIDAERFQIMRARAVFQLGVAQIRREGTAPGARTPEPAAYDVPRVTPLGEDHWRLLATLKREFSHYELERDLWDRRAWEARMTVQAFCDEATHLDEAGLIGRFAVVLPHHGERSPHAQSALLHWTVEPGQELAAGLQLGRHEILTHAYWRDGGAAIGGANLFGVLHAADRAQARVHKAAIDANLRAEGFAIAATGIHWSLRSEVRPSEILPAEYRRWWDDQQLPDARPGSVGAPRS